MQNDVYKRLACIEAIINAQKAEMDDVLLSAYKRACEDHNEQDAAEFARKIRNKLLDRSDKEMSLDRLGLDTSSSTKFITSLAKTFTGGWAKYRQALRDLSEQDGFPFNIEFPKEPDSERGKLA